MWHVCQVKIHYRLLDGRMSLETHGGFAGKGTKPVQALSRLGRCCGTGVQLDGVADLGGGALLIHRIAVHLKAKNDLRQKLNQVYIYLYTHK